MEKEPFVSIVIPTTGEVKYIRGLVQSVITLDYPKDKFELIFIGDKTTKLIEKNSKIAKEKGIDVTVEYNPVAAGQKRNIGANLAKGSIIAFTDDDTIRNLNSQYRDIDRPTDVLSFPQDMENNILGDIIVSVEKAKVQAEEKQHDLEQEMALLVAHGFLHLLGYDHAEPEEEKRMFSLQDRLLQHFYQDCFGKELV